MSVMYGRTVTSQLSLSSTLLVTSDYSRADPVDRPILRHLRLDDGYACCLISRRWNRTTDRPIRTTDTTANTAALTQSIPLLRGSLPR